MAVSPPFFFFNPEMGYSPLNVLVSLILVQKRKLFNTEIFSRLWYSLYLLFQGLPGPPGGIGPQGLNGTAGLDVSTYSKVNHSRFGYLLKLFGRHYHAPFYSF